MVIRPGITSHRGFSLIESLVAVALTLVVIGAVATLVDPLRGAFQVQVEAADVRQRLRVAADRLAADLGRAGSGPYAGPDGGSLISWFAPVLPYRRGIDPAGSFATDRLTLWMVPVTASQTSLSAAIDVGQLTLEVRQTPGCPVAQPLCGFTQGMRILVYDSYGRFDTFDVESVSGNTGRLVVSNESGVPSTRYEVGANVTEVIERSYFIKRSAQGFNQLVYADGFDGASVPVIDHLARLQLEYFGDPQPPVLFRDTTHPLGALTSYGPVPPGPSDRFAAYLPGENCAFRLDPESGVPVPRLAVLTNSDSRALVPLGAAELSDGDVWCPHAGDPNRFDADLLRIRKIGVRIAVESAIDSLRGPMGRFFSRAGTATDGRQLVPDQEVRFEVSLPNLTVSR